MTNLIAFSGSYLILTNLIKEHYHIRLKTVKDYQNHKFNLLLNENDFASYSVVKLSFYLFDYHLGTSGNI